MMSLFSTVFSICNVTLKLESKNSNQEKQLARKVGFVPKKVRTTSDSSEEQVTIEPHYTFFYNSKELCRFSVCDLEIFGIYQVMVYHSIIII